MDQSLSYYIDRYTTGTITSEELKVLARLLKDPTNQAVLQQLMDDSWTSWQDHQMDFSDVTDRVETALQQRIAAKAGVADTNMDTAPAQRVHVLRKWAWAAAIVFVAGTGIAIALSSGGQSDKLQSGIPSAILPGGDKAVLTLADGTEIILDSTANGNLAQQGNAAIVKMNDGQIVYNVKDITGNEVMMNTMATPKGGQYQLVLPDGSRVWLNAASSIQFPVAFAGATRRVKISGEVYFEIAQNKEKPFFVELDGKSAVQVLGTSFNVNSYANEENIKTTLVEGSVRVGKIPEQVPAEKTGVLLKPGQQAVLHKSDGSVSVQPADIEQILAWKNGLFNFNGLALPVVMRQLERWYNIEVKYEGNTPDLIFRGKMFRSSNLSDALDILQKLGVKCRLEGKTLFVL
ncbi:MAG: FecR family protein [Pseudobacter sp.]|uniref:FecR family protein n=1 Tax=Pseudobacter sp. TaxID=2045420 RepID=UPI003F7EF3CC